MDGNATCQQLTKPALFRRSTQPGFSAPWRLLEQVERTEVFFIQSDVLNTEVQRFCHTFKCRVVKGKDEVREGINHSGIVAGVD
jgi:hypothetical protein